MDKKNKLGNRCRGGGGLEIIVPDLDLINSMVSWVMRCKLEWMDWLIARAWNKVVSHFPKFQERIELKTGRENRSPSLKIIPQLIKRRKKRNWSKLRTKFECNRLPPNEVSTKGFYILYIIYFISYSIASGRWYQRRLRLLRDDPGHVHHEHEPGGAERGKKRTILNKKITWEIGWMFCSRSCKWSPASSTWETSSSGRRGTRGRS